MELSTGRKLNIIKDWLWMWYVYGEIFALFDHKPTISTYEDHMRFEHGIRISHYDKIVYIPMDLRKHDVYWMGFPFRKVIEEKDDGKLFIPFNQRPFWEWLAREIFFKQREFADIIIENNDEPWVNMIEPELIIPSLQGAYFE